MTIDVSASSLIGFGDAAAMSNGRHLGRFRRGDTVVAILDAPQIPDSCPYAVVLDEDANVITTGNMAMDGPTRRRFRFTYTPGAESSTGGFKIYCGFYASGEASILSRSFEVVPGGDSGGSVVAMHSTSRPHGTAVIAQLGSGRLAVGRNPST
jgi:hypothetical protein